MRERDGARELSNPIVQRRSVLPRELLDGLEFAAFVSASARHAPEGMILVYVRHRSSNAGSLG